MTIRNFEIGFSITQFRCRWLSRLKFKIGNLLSHWTHAIRRLSHIAFLSLPDWQFSWDALNWVRWCQGIAFTYLFDHPFCHLNAFSPMSQFPIVRNLINSSLRITFYLSSYGEWQRKGKNKKTKRATSSPPRNAGEREKRFVTILFLFIFFQFKQILHNLKLANHINSFTCWQIVFQLHDDEGAEECKTHTTHSFFFLTRTRRRSKQSEWMHKNVRKVRKTIRFNRIKTSTNNVTRMHLIYSVLRLKTTAVDKNGNVIFIPFHLFFVHLRWIGMGDGWTKRKQKTNEVRRKRKLHPLNENK